MCTAVILSVLLKECPLILYTPLLEGLTCYCTRLNICEKNKIINQQNARVEVTQSLNKSSSQAVPRTVTKTTQTTSQSNSLCLRQVLFQLYQQLLLSLELLANLRVGCTQTINCWAVQVKDTSMIQV